MRFYTNIYSLFLALVVLLALVHAQANDDNTSATTNTRATNTDDTTTSSRSATRAASSASSATDSESDSSSGSATASRSSTGSDAAITQKPDASTTADGDGAGVITDAPTVSNAIPSYPAATVPPTVDAPFMQKSNLPQGTVFICVGAVLAFALVVVMAWRATVAFLLRRSIKRARDNGYMHPIKDYSTGNGKHNSFYAQGMSSTLSLDPLTGSGNGRGNTKSGLMPQSVKDSLFFSPTAGANSHSAAGNRASGYLPAGYYAAGASVAGGGVAGNGRPISMADFTNTRPQSSGYQPARTAESPRDSPSIRPTQPHDSPYGRLTPAGMSSASLGQKSEGRAPSAYLDDLFDYPPVAPSGHDR